MKFDFGIEKEYYFIVLETPHAVVGAAIAFKIANPALSLPLALGSHFILEKIPHWNPHLNTELEKYGKITRQSTRIIIFDVLLSLVLAGSIAYKALPDTNHFLTILGASLIAVLPDVVEGPHFFLNFRHPYLQKWIEWQKSIQSDYHLLPGLITQLLTIIVAFWWILN